MTLKRVSIPFVPVIAAAILVLAGAWLRLCPVSAASPVQQDVPQVIVVKTMEGDGTVGPGETVRFRIGVTNTGQITVSNVTVQDDYDESVLPTIKVLSGDDISTGSAQNDGHMLTWQVDGLPPGAGWHASYEASAAEKPPPDAIQVSNEVVVLVDGARVAQAGVPVVVRAPDLTLTRQSERVDGDDQITPGAVLRYTIRYSNKGSADASNVIIEEAYESAVVQQVSNITADGAREGANMIRWYLGTVAAGDSGEVSYEATLKPALARGGEIDRIYTQASIEADQVDRLTAEESIPLSIPQLSIFRTRDLTGEAVHPGDTVQFTIHVRNVGEVDVSEVVVRDDFDERVVAEVSEISGDGTEIEGAVEWTLTTGLKPTAEKSFTYKVRLIGEIGQATNVTNVAIIKVREVELARYQTTMKIESVREEPDTPQVFEKEPVTVSVLIGVSSVAALLVLGVLAMVMLRRGQWKEHHLRTMIEGVAVVVIVEAVLILAMSKNIEPDGAVTILSGTAGYLLGRGVSGLGGGGG